jgi:CRP/FNR family transcriptional regulator, anaerobic regulatory protein
MTTMIGAEFDVMSPPSSRGRLTPFADLTEAEASAFQSLAGEHVTHRRGDVIRREGDPDPRLYLLLDGWAAASMTLPDGRRQIVKIHLPGDLMGAPSLPLEEAADTLIALTDANVARVSRKKLANIFLKLPRLATLLYLTAQEERIILMDRLLSVGRLDAKQRITAFLLHIHHRVGQTSTSGSSVIPLPLTQEQLGDFLGLTPVHVNRVLKALERENMISRSRKTIELVQMEELRALCGLSPRKLRRNLDWLPPPTTELTTPLLVSHVRSQAGGCDV